MLRRNPAADRSAVDKAVKRSARQDEKRWLFETGRPGAVGKASGIVRGTTPRTTTRARQRMGGTHPSAKRHSTQHRISQKSSGQQLRTALETMRSGSTRSRGWHRTRSI